MEKRVVLEKVIAAVEAEMEHLEANAAGAHQTSIEAPSAMQSHSDTTRYQMKTLEENAKKVVLERQALVREVRELLADAASADEIGIGSCVVVSDGARTSAYVILNGGAGISVEHENERWVVVTPRSPLGKALTGKRKGDVFTFSAGGKERELEIVEVI